MTDEAREALVRYEERIAAKRLARRIGKPAATGKKAREQIRHAATRKVDDMLSQSKEGPTMTTAQAIARVDRAQLHGLSPDLVAAIRLLAATVKASQ